LSVNFAKRRDRARRPEAIGCCQRGVKSGFVDCAAGRRGDEEIVGAIGAEEVGGDGTDNSLAQSVAANQSGNDYGISRWTSRARTSSRQAKQQSLAVARRRSPSKSPEVFNQKIGPRRADVLWVRQVMRADENVTSRNRHVFRQLPLDREICLVGVRVFKVFADGQGEREEWTEAHECLIVEAYSTRKILGRRRYAGGG